MRQIVAKETGRTLVFDDFGIDWQGLGYTLKLEATDANEVTRIHAISPSVTYPHGGQIVGTDDIMPISGRYTCVVYEENNLYISSRFTVTIGQGHY